MTVTSAATTATAPAALAASKPRGFASLGSADFLKLLTVQMQQQDPFDPVDNKEMLAQMAQFSSLSETAEVSATLKEISAKLDKVIAANGAATPSSSTPTATTGA